jgi:hypothetical protein
MIDFFREIWEKSRTLRYLAGVVPARHLRSCHRSEGDGLFSFRQACSKTCQASSGSKPSLKTLRRLKKIEELPPSQQKALFKTIDNFLKGAEKE